MRILGALFFVIGLIAMGFFMFNFDTTVGNNNEAISSFLPAGSSGRTHNLGLLADKICGMIGGAGLTIAGAVLGNHGVPADKK
jgi:hypothetical protein